MSPITTHVLDTRLGQPAAGVSVTIQKKDGQDWREIAHGLTQKDGRICDLLPPGSLTAGSYQIHFDTGSYFKSTGTDVFYPEICVVFQVADESQHYHVPLLLSPFGYSTYRGS